MIATLINYFSLSVFSIFDLAFRMLTLGRFHLRQLYTPNVIKKIDEEAKEAMPGCKHYVRKCQLRCPECKEFFTCRLCHDEVKFYGEMDPKKNH